MVDRTTVSARVPLPGELVIDAPVRRGSACREGCRGAHSWTDDGRRVCWRPDDFVAGLAPSETRGRAAVDVERTCAQVPPSLARRWPAPSEEFWSAWTRTEVLAKLGDVPVLAWLARYGLGDPPAAADGPWSGVRLWTAQVGDLTVTVGRRPQEVR